VCDVGGLREEPDAGKPHVRICEGEAEWLSYSTAIFLFKTAYHLLIDRVRRERIVSIEATGGIEDLNVLIDEISPEQRVSARQELKRLARAFDALPPRCREVIWMRRVLDISQKEVAEQLGVHEKAIEKQVARGVRLLADQMFAGESMQGRPKTHREPDSEHGKQS
jgi:RNA polymerase sigma factor (sigma-70 family)